MIYFAEGNAQADITPARISELVDTMLRNLGRLDRVLVLPPDFTRFHSFAGEITCMLYEKLKNSSHIEILPTVGTHAPLSRQELNTMYPGIPHELFIRHHWKEDVIRLGTLPPETVRELTAGLVEWPLHCEVNRNLVERKWDQVISVGQLVPHELVGIANHTKNLLIGAGGKDIIGKTHMIGALYGTEKLMGRIHSPVRRVLDHLCDHFLGHLPISYILTVRSTDPSGRILTREIFAGDDRECYLKGAGLCQQVNITLLEKQYSKVVAWMDPEEYKSTWVGNKAIYRTRMAVADGGELLILCPGITTFGEDPAIDAFIRKYGYRNMGTLLQAAEENGEMEDNLAPLSHLVISSPENRFRVTYAVSKIPTEELESVNCDPAEYHEVIRKYDPSRLSEGVNILPGGEEIYFISRPAQGLWTEINTFKNNDYDD
jgi:nickel-dependent lactate racemase